MADKSETGLGSHAIDAATRKLAMQKIGDSVIKKLLSSDLLEEQIKMNVANNLDHGHKVKEMAWGIFRKLKFDQTCSILL